MLAAETARWFADRRGISVETLEAFGIETEDNGVRIPYPDGVVKHRATLEKVDGAHKMWFAPTHPDGQPPFLPPDFRPGSHMIVFEGETDTMKAWQAAPSEAKPHILGMPGAHAFGPKGFSDQRIQDMFGDAKHVYFVLDNEDPYEGNIAYESVERGWKQIKEKLGRKAHRVTLPGNVQDACEFFSVFDWAAFKVLLEDAQRAKYHFAAIDFSKERPVREWVVEGLLGKGEIVLASGDGGTGKSLLFMDLGAHIARGDDTWLGMKLDAERIMFIDQENPDVEVWDRLFALGFKPDQAAALRYIWYQHILLDDAETVSKLYDDVSTFQPTVLVLDSMSRLHLKNENANEEMNPLINGAIFPLARTMDTTVVMLHHTRKDGRTRGATAIRNAVDLALDVSLAEDGSCQIVRPDKPRAITANGSSLYIFKETDDTGRITLTPEEDRGVI